MCRIGNPEWLEISVYHDDYVDDDDISPRDDDYVPEEYHDDDL